MLISKFKNECVMAKIQLQYKVMPECYLLFYNNMPMSHFNEHTQGMAIMELFEQQGYSYMKAKRYTKS